MPNIPNFIFVASVNVRSLIKEHRFREILHFFKMLKLDILCIQEARLSQTRADRLNATFPGMRLLINPNNDERPGGVAIMINPNTVRLNDAELPNVMGDYSSENFLYDAAGRLLVARLNCSGQQLNIACVYVPADSTERSAWLENTTDLLVSLEGRLLCDIVGGDWNMVTHIQDHTSTRRPNLQERHRLLTFLSYLNDETDLIDGYREHFPDSIMYTHTGPNSAARLDRIYVTPAISYRSCEWDTHVLPKSLNLDHLMVTARIKPYSPTKRGPGRFRFKCNLLKSQPVQARLTVLVNKLKESPVTPARWTLLKNELESTLSAIVRTKSQALTSARLRAKRRRTRLLLRRRASPNPSLERKLAAATVRESQLNEYATKAFAYSAMAKNRLLGEKPTKWFYSRCSASSLSNVSALKSSRTNTLVENPQDLPAVAADFYKSLFAVRLTNPSKGRNFIDLMPKLPRALSESTSVPITSTEVKAVLKGAATGKSPGPDGLPVELFKEVFQSSSENAETLCEGLAQLFNSLLQEERADESFSVGVLSILYKNKGSPQDLKNYRPLTVANSDYKLFTGILAKRLCSALNGVVGPHQYAFLPGRLIDDNIRLVQSIIDENQGSETEGVYLLFIDQEKAYDRVDHKFLWRLLKQVGLPEPIRHAIKALYANVKLKVMVNGFASKPFPVRSGVRQGDPLSCILYVLFLEPLIRKIQTSEIEGITIPNSAPIKAVCYADDTVLVLKNQTEVDLARSILQDFCEGTGAQINWNKSSILKVGNPPPITIPEVSFVSPDNPYFHLGVPIGTNTEVQIQNLWDSVRLTFETIATRWSKAHLSLKGRIMVANSLMLSIPRYHLKFIPISPQTLSSLVKIYYDFIWDQKWLHKIHDLHALLPPEKGGIGSFDLSCVIEALSAEAVAKLESRDDLPWVQIQRRLLAKLHTRTRGEILSVITRPWVQQVSSRDLKMSELPSGIRHMWIPWLRLLKSDSDTISIGPPKTKQDVLNINFWYHRDLTVRPGQGARRFSNFSFRFLAELGISSIGEVWDPGTRTVILPATLPAPKTQAMTQAITNLIRDLPAPWLELLNDTSLYTSSTSDQLCLSLGSGDHKKMAPLHKFRFREIYRQLVSQKTKDVNYDARVQPILQIYTNHTGKRGNLAMIWRAARHEFLTPKQGDLLWRLLHAKVKIGQDLHWLPRESQICPNCIIPSSIEHLWIECPAAQHLWCLVRTIWDKAWDITDPNTAKPAFPQIESRHDLACWLALAPVSDRFHARRWKVLFGTAVWSIWISYLRWSYSEDLTALFPASIRALFLTLLRNRFQEDRLLSLNSLYTNKTYNVEAFKLTWGQPPSTARAAISVMEILPPTS